MVGVNRNRDNLTCVLFCGLIGISLSKLIKRMVSQKKFFFKKNFFFSLDLKVCEWVWRGKVYIGGLGLEAGLGARGG